MAATEHANLPDAVIPTDERLSATFFGLLDAAPDAIVTVDGDGSIVLANAQTEQLFGYTRDELLGQRVDLLVPERFRAAHPAHRASYVADPHTRPMGAQLELYGRRKDGTEFPVEISLSPVETEDGVLVTSIIRDVTDRKREQAKFRALLESAPDAIVGVDAEGRIALVNARTEELFGWSRDDLVGRPVELLMPERHRGRHAGHRAGYVHNPHTRPMGAGSELLGRRKDGTEFPVEISLSPLETEDGLLVTSIIRDVTDRKAAERQLQYLADHDPLTGLLNRRCFESALERALVEARRHGPGVGLLLLDIDDFKYVNDSRGHSFGDELIRGVAASLREEVRASDVLARLGGDEFAVLLPHAAPEEAQLTAARLCQALRERQPAGGRVRLTASIGVASSLPGDAHSADDLLVRADLAMYDAKEAGRDGWAVFEAETGEAAGLTSRQTWVERLRHALDHDEFLLYAQPMVSLTEQDTAQYELLLRLRHNGEIAEPAAFIGTAEHFGLIKEIDRWVLREAIRLAAATAGPSAPRFSVNLSAKSLGDPMLAAMIESELAASGVAPDRLILEVTETAAIANMDEAIAFAERLKRLGCRFALDDFGAGFGSFYYVKHLPLDAVKIDGEFIRHLATSADDRVLVQAIVGIARGLGHETVAEFVGDDATLAILRDDGVDYAQGFHVGRPAPVEAVLGLPPRL